MENDWVMSQTNQLSEREKEVVKLLLQGKSNKQIAFMLDIADRTVEFHLKNVYTKLQVSSRTEAILKLGESTGSTTANIGESTVDVMDEKADNNKRELILQRQGISVMTLKISLQEIGRFLVSYKIPIFIWILLAVILVFVLSTKSAWSYEREGEYPDDSTVGQMLERTNASGSKVHGQFGTVAAWPAKSGFVKYNNINTPQTDHLYLKLRYSKYSPASVSILIFIDNEIVPRSALIPDDQGDWNNFAWTESIDLGSVERGVHSIMFYTDGQEYGVADLDKFILTTESP
jgi:DNA-binding CsgD family transcriptional regulator